jgi:hypothetical protein
MTDPSGDEVVTTPEPETAPEAAPEPEGTDAPAADEPETDNPEAAQADTGDDGGVAAAEMQY